MYNLLKVLNKNEPLENLQSIDEVYDNQADMCEEIIFYNKLKIKKTNRNKENYCNNALVIRNNNEAATINNDKSQFILNENETEEDEYENHNDYIKKLKKSVLLYKI